MQAMAPARETVMTFGAGRRNTGAISRYYNLQDALAINRILAYSAAGTLPLLAILSTCFTYSLPE